MSFQLECPSNNVWTEKSKLGKLQQIIGIESKGLKQNTVVERIT